MKAREYKTIIILTLAFTQVTMAVSIPDVVHQGNKLYDKGNFSDALKEYDQALIEQPQALEPKFNKANCYFQLDDLSKAIDIYNEVAANSKDMKLVEKAKYNLGNCYFNRGSKQKDSNLQKALEDLQTSIVYWRSALEIDPENEKAAKNIEVARLIIKDIIDQINKQKEQQQQQAAQQKQLQEQLKELLEQQKALAERTQETNDQMAKEQISREQAVDNYKNQGQEQSQLSAKTEETLQQIQKQDPNSPLAPQLQQAGSELEQAADAQSNAETQLDNSEGIAAKKYEDKAVEHIENALKALSQENRQGQQQQQQQQQQQGQQQDPNQAEQEQQQEQKEQQAAVTPDTTAQEILDKEKQDKKQRQVLQQGGYQKVEKDW